jgi:hypothetical protein
MAVIETYDIFLTVSSCQSIRQTRAIDFFVEDFALRIHRADAGRAKDLVACVNGIADQA